MLRLITFLEEAAGVELVLPVTPSSYQWAHEAAIETVTVDQLGDLNFFGGKDTPAAFVNFKILGSLGRENCEILNEEFLTDVSQVLGIQKERIFVAHDECPSWGWVKN